VFVVVTTGVTNTVCLSLCFLYTDKSGRHLPLWRSSQMVLQRRKLPKTTRRYILHQVASLAKKQAHMKV